MLCTSDTRQSDRAGRSHHHFDIWMHFVIHLSSIKCRNPFPMTKNNRVVNELGKMSLKKKLQ